MSAQVGGSKLVIFGCVGTNYEKISNTIILKFIVQGFTPRGQVFVMEMANLSQLELFW